MVCLSSRLILLIFLAAALLPAGARAGAITVSPLRVELNARHPVAALDVSNESDDPVSVELERFAWSQAGGEDLYTESGELIATPTVFDLPPHGTQTLRVALRSPSGTGEQAFRLYARELPRPSVVRESGLQIALRIGIPVFFVNPSGKPQLKAATLPGDPGKLQLRVNNAGARYTRVLGIDIKDAGGTLVFHSTSPVYLLAGGEHVWPVEIGAAQAAGALQVALRTENGTERIEALPEH